MVQSDIILYAAGSQVIVDFEEVCLKNNIDIKAIVNNQTDNPVYATLKDKVVSLSQLSAAYLSVPFLSPLFSPHNRYLAVNQAMKFGLKPYSLSPVI
jgi:hypothetical protein